ncbi:hypothetical protein JB92DRAFT_752413 [Gautieria morchelliformis]|nr:hypothetical protein JB92DRAFT_752413 [Gautieria morchelliformis]
MPTPDDLEKLPQHVNLNANITARIQNPLAGIPCKKLLANVDEFARERGMEDILPILWKGALVAQNPPDFESIVELEPAEREALQNEVLHKWRQPRALYLAVVLC